MVQLPAGRCTQSMMDRDDPGASSKPAVPVSSAGKAGTSSPSAGNTERSPPSRAAAGVSWADELRRAQDASFRWTNYPQLRAVQLFKAPFRRDVWQPKLTLKVPMTAGLGRGRSGRAGAAAKMHAKLQSLCGDRPSARPNAVNIGIIHGIVAGDSALSTELWLQLLRHTSNNTDADSLVKAWRVAAFAASATLVPASLRPFLLHELQARRAALSSTYLLCLAPVATRLLTALHCRHAPAGGEHGRVLPPSVGGAPAPPNGATTNRDHWIPGVVWLAWACCWAERQRSALVIMLQVAADCDPQLVDVALVDGETVIHDWPLKPNETAADVLLRALAWLHVDVDDPAAAAVEWGLFERSHVAFDKVRVPRRVVS